MAICLSLRVNVLRHLGYQSYRHISLQERVDHLHTKLSNMPSCCCSGQHVKLKALLLITLAKDRKIFKVIKKYRLLKLLLTIVSLLTIPPEEKKCSCLINKTAI